MYDKFKNELMAELFWLDHKTLKKISLALDKVSDGYDINKKETSIAVQKDTFPEVLKVYLVTKKIEGLSDETLNQYALTVMNFFSVVCKPINEIQSNDIRLYLVNYQRTHNIQLVTLNKYREYICRFFTWANNENYIESNPGQNIKPIKYEKKQRRALTQIELEQVRESCITIRESAIVELLYSTGCRVSELCNLKLEDINWDEGTVHLYGKGRKHRTSYLNPKATLVLKKYLESRNDNCDAVISTERRPYKKLTKEGMEVAFQKIIVRAFGKDYDKITPHTMRHTTATTALQRGMPITDISALLGHDSINTTMIYAEVSDESVKANHKKCII